MIDICVIFDLDGTLVDSETLCNQAFLDLLPELDESLEALVDRYRGKKLGLILADLGCRLGYDLPDCFETRYRQRVSELFESELKPVAGVCEMLEAIHYRRCIASSGPLPKIRHALSVSGLDAYFGDRIFSAYDVGSWKPEPGLFLHAAHVMGFEPARCVVVEDSDVGIAAAVAAGMAALHYTPNGGAPAVTNGFFAFNSMRNLPALLHQFADRVAT